MHQNIQVWLIVTWSADFESRLMPRSRYMTHQFPAAEHGFRGMLRLIDFNKTHRHLIVLINFDDKGRGNCRQKQREGKSLGVAITLLATDGL